MPAVAETRSLPKVCVIYNPQAGRRRAEKRLARFRDRWESAATFWPTAHARQGRELACRAVEQEFTVVAAAGGDGTVHEVANGLLSASSHRPKPTLAVVPIGSANDYAYSLSQEFGPSDLMDDNAALVDVGYVATSLGHSSYFVESIGLGLSARVTEASRRATRGQGLWLYGLAAAKAILCSMESQPLRLHWDDGPPTSQSTLLLSLMLGVREGGFRLAPSARLNDGLFDVVHALDLSRLRAIAMLPRLAFHGPPPQDPHVILKRCRQLRIVSPTALAIHTDGEMFATRKDGVRDVTIRLLPSHLKVKVCRL